MWMRGRCAGSEPRLGLSPLALISRLTGRFRPVVSSILRGERGLDIFQRQLHLVAIKLLGSAAELCALELLQQWRSRSFCSVMR